MGPRKFKEMLDQIPRLTPVQKQRLMHGVQTSVKCDELPEPVRHGKSAGLCRFRCRSASCGRTFHALTGTHLAGLRHKSKWSVFEACLRDRLTLHQSAERCGIAYRTAFLWRHRLLGKQQKGSKLQSIVEMDETYFLESCKGDRSLTERRLARERGGNRGHRGLVSDQRPVWTAVVRVSRREARRGSWHLNTVNQRHMTMKRWLNHHHRGVSTRYLNHYMHWLMRSEFKLEQSIEADFLSPHLASYTQVDT